MAAKNTTKNDGTTEESITAETVEEKAVIPAQRSFTDEELQNITSIDDALELMRNLYGEEGIFTADQIIGNGFRVLSGEDRNRLVGVPCAFLKWTFNPGRFNDEFASVYVVSENGEKYVMNGSGAGFYSQLRDVSDNRGVTGGMVVKHGLTRSQYEYCETCQSTRCEDESHKRIEAVTYYIDVSA